MSLRVLMTADTSGGVWVHALALCRGLAPAGVRVRLVALGQPSPQQRRAAHAAGNVELVVRPVRLEWMTQPWQDLDDLEGELLHQAEAGECDLVHLNHLVHGHLRWRRPVVCAVHSCVLSWFEAVRGEPAPPQWDTYRRRVSRSLQAADCVVAPSRWMLEQAVSLYGPFRARHAIANGSAAPLADPRAPRRGIVAAGRVWDEAKNLAPLVAMAERLPVRVAGPRADPDGGSAAPGAVAPEPEPEELDQDALWALMRRSSLFAAPARYEPFGLGILEAARSGCALVLADIPPLRELWSGAAEFIDPRRPGEWTRTLEALLGNDERRQGLAAAAGHRAVRYGVETMAAEYLALYRQAEAEPAARAVS